MTAGRTVWQAQDSAWWRRERIVLLGEQFGSEGPAIANWLECEAKAQNDAGSVKAGYTTAGRGAFVSGGATRAQEIIEFAVRIGFLKDYEPGDFTFTARVAAYEADQPAGRAAFRKQVQRDRQDEDETTQDAGDDTVTERDTVTPSHAPSRPSTREESREEEKSSLRSDSARGARSSKKAEPADFGEWLAYHAERSGRGIPGVGTGGRADLARTFAALQSEGFTLDDFKLATDGVLADQWKRENGHDKFVTVLRKSKFGELVEDGRRARTPHLRPVPQGGITQNWKRLGANGGAL